MVGAAKVGEGDHEQRVVDLGACPDKQFQGRDRRAAGRDEIVDQDTGEDLSAKSSEQQEAVPSGA